MVANNVLKGTVAIVVGERRVRTRAGVSLLAMAAVGAITLAFALR